MSIIDYSSESGPNNNHNKAIDKIKNYNGWDFWETDYNGNDTKLYMTFDLGRVYSLAEVNYYYSRDEGGSNGDVHSLSIRDGATIDYFTNDIGFGNLSDPQFNQSVVQ